MVGRSRIDSVCTFLQGTDGIEDLLDQIVNTRLYGWVRLVGGEIHAGYVGDPFPAEIYRLEDSSGVRKSSSTPGIGDRVHRV